MEQRSRTRVAKKAGCRFPDTGTYRPFLCSCKKSCKICSKCDRGNIYCRPCAPIKARIRKRKADQKYRGTERGKFMRRRQSNRRYLKSRKKRSQQALAASVDTQGEGSASIAGNATVIDATLVKEQFLGDRGSPFQHVRASFFLLALEPAKGVTNDEAIREPLSARAASLAQERRNSVFLCELCGCECAPFCRKLGRTRIDRLAWRRAQRKRDGPTLDKWS